MREQLPKPPYVLPNTSAPKVRNMVASICRQSLEEYRQAGYPFGKTMDGMLIWFEHGQATTDN